MFYDLLNDRIVSGTNQDHEIASCRSGADIDLNSLETGRLLRILPDHACTIGAMFDRYYVINGSMEVINF